jgi:hypothetical protein
MNRLEIMEQSKVICTQIHHNARILYGIAESFLQVA